MSARRDPLPPPVTEDVLARRFSIGSPPAPTPHTPHTAPPGNTAQPAPDDRRSEPVGMVRRTYYYSEPVADALAAAVDRIHYDSRGRIPKHAALDAIIAAGVAQLDDIAARLLADS